MTKLKKHIAYTFLVLLVISVGTAIMGATGIVSIPQTGLIGIFAVAITQCVTVITALIKAPNYFDDPPAVAQARQAHAQDIKQTTSMALQLHEVDAQEIATLQARISELEQQMDSNAIDHLNEKRRWVQAMQDKDDHTQRPN